MERRFLKTSFVILGAILAVSFILLPVHAEARNIKVGP